MIIRNHPLAHSDRWFRENNPQAVDVARRFLFGEAELLHLNHAKAALVEDIHDFLRISAELPVTVECSGNGDILIRAVKANDSMMLTGKTAEVLRSYFDHQNVTMEDRLEMTERRVITAADRARP